MKYIDYRKRLGIGFDDTQIETMLINKVFVAFKLITPRLDNTRNHPFCYGYFSEVGETPKHPLDFDLSGICHSIISSGSVAECICKFVVFINVLQSHKLEQHHAFFKSVLLETLDELSITYEMLKDGDKIFIFPKGAKELDDALVSEPLEWLIAYPKTRKAWIDALKAYSTLDSDNASDVADKFRKALERFFQEFFNTTKSLEHLKSEYGNYLKSKGVPPEISNNLEVLQQSYTNFMNNYAKHHDKTSDKLLEYIMYQTGNIIRLLITLK